MHLLPRRSVAPLVAALLAPAALAQPAAESPMPAPTTEPAGATAEAASAGPGEGQPDAVVDLDGDAAGQPTVDAPLRPLAAVAVLPPALDRSAWQMPAGSPAATDALSLWDEECYRCHVADRFEADPLAEPSTIAAMERALSTHGD